MPLSLFQGSARITVKGLSGHSRSSGPKLSSQSLQGVVFTGFIAVFCGELGVLPEKPEGRGPGRQETFSQAEDSLPDNPCSSWAS